MAELTAARLAAEEARAAAAEARQLEAEVRLPLVSGVAPRVSVSPAGVDPQLWGGCARYILGTGGGGGAGAAGC
eukprot:COSAG01_NODE_3637_length_5841_cov_105.166493_7_plen_74_part_00